MDDIVAIGTDDIVTGGNEKQFTISPALVGSKWDSPLSAVVP
jgi:hypothetical protein